MGKQIGGEPMNQNHNQYQNNNEMQIIKPSSDTLLYSHNNYPYATDPDTIAQGRSYKNWLDTCEGVDEPRSPEAAAIRDVIAAMISIGGGISSALGIPGAGAVGSLFTTLLNKLWPAANAQWEAFMEHVEALINAKIAEYARNKALSELAGLGNNFKIYIQALKDWQQDPTRQDVRINVAERFRILDSLFEQYMPSFAVSGYEVPLLTVYTNAANLHLLLLRDSSIYGRDWGMEQSEVDANYNRQIRHTAEYANHCTTWYQTGLQRLQGTTGNSWVTYNRFRREMTLTVLDIVALFSNYDYRTYPVAVRGQLTREIYTDPVAPSSWLSRDTPSFATIENLAIRAPHMFTRLYQLTINTGKLESLLGAVITSNYYWSRHTIKVIESQGGPLASTYGATTGTIYRTDTLYLSSYGDIYTVTSGVVSRSSQPGGDMLGVNSARFTAADHVYLNENPRVFPGSNIVTELPGKNSDTPTAADYSHRLSYVTAFQAGLKGTVLVDSS